MPIAKREIVDLLLTRRDLQRAIRADEQLPEVVHVELHSGLLRDLGIDPALLMGELGEPSRPFSTVAGRPAGAVSRAAGSRATERRSLRSPHTAVVSRSDGAAVPDDHVIVLFGALGDLSRRKLLPGLFHLDRAGLMPAGYRIIGTSRSGGTDEDFRARRPRRRSATARRRDVGALRRAAGVQRLPRRRARPAAGGGGARRGGARRRAAAPALPLRPARRVRRHGHRARRVRAWPTARGSCWRSRSASTSRARARSTRSCTASSRRSASSGSTTSSGARPCRT